MVGRMEGLECQHSEHIHHHSSVKREHVFSALGRSGGPFKILIRMGMVGLRMNQVVSIMTQAFQNQGEFIL